MTLWPCDFGPVGDAMHHGTSAWWARQSANLVAGQQKDVKGPGHRHSPANSPPSRSHPLKSKYHHLPPNTTDWDHVCNPWLLGGLPSVMFSRTSSSTLLSFALGVGDRR